jgi:hypothetical protein
VAASPPPQNSNVAIKITPGNGHINPLPLSANEAARRFGLLTPAQIRTVSTTSSRLLDTCDGPNSAWSGPELIISHATDLDYHDSTIGSVCDQLRAKSITSYDPYSLGKEGNETDAVVMARLDEGAGAPPKWTAIAFVLNGDQVRRIVIAPQPWVTLMPEHH